MRLKIVRAIDWFIGHRVIRNAKLDEYLKRAKSIRPSDKELLGKDTDGNSWPHYEDRPYAN